MSSASPLHIQSLIRVAVLGLITTVAAVACSKHDARPMEVSVAPGELYLDSVPLMTLGGANAAEEFGDVVGVGRLSDDGLVVGDRVDGRLLLYDSTGEPVRSIGGRGRGQGELAQLIWAGVLPGDTLIAFDQVYGKFSLFTPDGAFVRSFQLERSSILRWPRPVAVLGDGFVLLDGSAFPASPTKRVVTGVHVESTVVARVRVADGVVDSIASYPSRRVYRSNGGRFAAPLPFTPRLSLAPDGRGVVAGFGSDSLVSVFGATGRREIAIPLPERELSRAAAERERKRRMTVAASSSPQMDGAPRALPVPSHFPRYDALAVDDRKRVWVRAYSEAREGAEHWIILDTAGVVADRATLPPRFDILAIAGDRILGTWRDADDAQYVGVFAVRRRDR